MGKKAIELQEQGKRKRVRKADALTEEDEEMLWSKSVLGDSSLNYSVFYFVSQSFGTRGRQEHHQVRIEHLKFKSSVRCYGVC